MERAGEAAGLLEREPELAALDGALAMEGGGGLLVLEGFAGTGKTQLVEWASDSARERGMEVLSARGLEVESSFPFGVILQLLERRVALADQAERAELLAGAAGLAAPLLQGERSPAGPEAVFSFQHGLYWLIANLAERRPVLVAVDDAHWADVPTLQFLNSLVQRLEGIDVAVVVASRPGEKGPSEPWLGRLAGLAASVLVLHPLSDAAVESVIRDQYDPDAEVDFCRACAEAVAGNPLYLRELLVALQARGIPATGHAARYIERVDPAGIQRAIGTRLERRGPAAIALAEAAGVVEQGLPLRLVAKLAGLEHEQAVEAAHALAEADVLTREDPLRFVHPVVRNAVYARVAGRRRAAMHRRAAEVLRDEAAEPERVAAHLERAETRGEEWAVHTLQAAAGTAGERGAHGTAAAWLQRAVDEGPPPAMRPALLARLGLARAAAGDLGAWQLVREAADLIPDATDRARYLMGANHFAIYARRYTDAFDLCRRALTGAEAAGHEETADEAAAAVVALAAITDAEPLEHELARVRRRADATLAGAALPRTPADRLSVCAVAGMAMWAGDLPAGRVREFAQAALAGVPGEEINGPMYQAALALDLAGDHHAADAALSLSIDAARRRGLLHHFTISSFARGECRYRAGRVAEATADLEAAMDGVRQGIIGFEPGIRGMYARCLLERGDVGGARSALELHDPGRWGTLLAFAYLHDSRGRLALATGRAKEARDAFREAGDLLARAGALNPAYCGWRSRAALAEHHLGNGDEALGLVAEELDRARAFGAGRAIGIALRTRGLLLGGTQGLASLDDAVDVLETAGARLEHARALLERGAFKRRARRPAEARDDLRHALDAATACGATGLAERARQELVSAGGRPRRERLHGPEALTPAERRVARMGSEGMSNPEIAQALFLTRKTIEAHMRSIFLKLDISRRTELAAALGEDPERDGVARSSIA